MNAQWQPIETAPTDGTAFLATDGKLRCIVAKQQPTWVISSQGKSIANVYVSGPVTANLDEAGVGELTHWMPLPEPPK